MESRAARELKEFDLVFKALAHPTRRYILTVLLAKGDEMNAGDIVEKLSYKWPTITRHLRQLENARLLMVKKEGTQQIYRLNKKHMNTVLKNWLQWF
jgi:DNA-binding transcriptional ArsR family regulator